MRDSDGVVPPLPLPVDRPQEDQWRVGYDRRGYDMI